MFWRRRARPVRVCCAAVLRIRDDDRIVLFESRTRLGAFAPPGGVIRYDGPASDTLGRLGFDCDHEHHLRGTLPTRAIEGFVRWFASGADREDGAACLRRSLVEVLAEFGVPGQNLSFDRFRTEIECSGPELRGFEFYDLVGESSARDRILSLATDPRVHMITSVTAEDVARGHVGAAVIAPHTAHLTARTPSLQ